MKYAILTMLLHLSKLTTRLTLSVLCAESIIPSSGVFVVKLAKRGAGLGITISSKLHTLSLLYCRCISYAMFTFEYLIFIL